MPLGMPWWNAIWLLRPAFSRLRTFLWFATAVAGFTVRTELLGVTSLVRALKLEARFYNKLVDHFHSPAVKLDRLSALWTQVVLRLFPQPLRINGRCIVVGDGIKIPKRGRKMPAVKLLHQQSESTPSPNSSWDIPSSNHQQTIMRRSAGSSSAFRVNRPKCTQSTAHYLGRGIIGC